MARDSTLPARKKLSDNASTHSLGTGQTYPPEEYSDGEATSNSDGQSNSASWRSRLLRIVTVALTAPFVAYLSLRRSMTVASVSVLLAVFMTMNVIWGFPWSGMMGACLAMLVVGFVINRAMCPRLKFSVSLPRTAVAGHPFSINVRLTNRRRVPALGMRVGWHYEGVRDVYPRKRILKWDASPPASVDLLRSGDQVQWHGAMRFDTRGIHTLPPFHIASTFPFHLFHCRTTIETKTQIAITPAPIGGDDDPTARLMLTTIGDWTQQLVAGAPVEYVGNREYQVGVPVRRWDFASWARLGRPIVREYQSPSIQAVTLIIDTSQRNADTSTASRAAAKRMKRDAAQLFERLMSVSATAITEISSRRVQLRLFLTNETETDQSLRRSAAPASDGVERLMVRLAAAKPVDPELGETRLRQAIDSSRGQPTLILSLFDLDSGERTKLAADLPPGITYLPIKPRQNYGADSNADARQNTSFGARE